MSNLSAVEMTAHIKKIPRATTHLRKSTIFSPATDQLFIKHFLHFLWEIESLKYRLSLKAQLVE